MSIDYEITYSFRRSISISVSNECVVIVKAPYGMSKAGVISFLNEKKSWILKQIEKKRKIAEKVQELGTLSEDDIKKLRKQAKDYIPARVQYYAERWGFSYNKVFIKVMKTRWGSCSSARNLNFNCLLMMMPWEVIDSVIVHELCHLKYMNHSRDFYKEVYKICPEYNRWDRWIKDNGGALIAMLCNS